MSPVTTISFFEVVPTGGASRIQATEPLGDGKTARGFKATLKDGRSISFVAAVSGSAELKAAGIQAKGEALLVNNDRGLALGCEQFQDKSSAT